MSSHSSALLHAEPNVIRAGVHHDINIVIVQTRSVRAIPSVCPSGERSTSGPAHVEPGHVFAPVLTARSRGVPLAESSSTGNRKISWLVRSKSQISDLVVLVIRVVVPLRVAGTPRLPGVPFESMRRQKKFRTCRRRSTSTSAGAPSSPSQPQFQLRLSVPSLLPCPLASLCL